MNFFILQENQIQTILVFHIIQMKRM